MEKNILLEIPAVVARQVVYFVIPFFFRCCCCTLAQLHDAINLKWGRESTVGRENFDTSRSKVSNIFCSMIDWNNFSALHYTAEFRICISHVSNEFCFHFIIWDLLVVEFIRFACLQLQSNAMHSNKLIKSPNRSSNLIY